MTDLSLPQPGLRSRYAGQSHRSPRTFAAALAFNGGIFALILALPATTYIVESGTPFRVTEVPIDRDPPPIDKPIEHKKPNPTQKTASTPQDETQTFVQPNSIFTTENDVRGSTDPKPVVLPIVEPLPPVPAHVPVFQSATRDPRFADAFHPAYPPTLQREGLEGSVTVRVTIDEKGRVIACELVKATNRAFFDETKEQALKRWRFRPATSDGVPVQSQQTLTVTFQLEA